MLVAREGEGCGVGGMFVVGMNWLGTYVGWWLGGVLYRGSGHGWNLMGIKCGRIPYTTPGPAWGASWRVLMVVPQSRVDDFGVEKGATRRRKGRMATSATEGEAPVSGKVPRTCGPNYYEYRNIKTSNRS